MKCLYVHPGMNAHSTEYAIIPMGLVGLVNLLREHAWTVRGINAPMERGLDPSFDLAARIRDFAPFELALVDLHWYVHTAGAIAAAQEIKAICPGATVVVGGITATQFDAELLSLSDAVDVVIRGDAELPLQWLAHAVSHGNKA